MDSVVKLGDYSPPNVLVVIMTKKLNKKEVKEKILSKQRS